MYSGFQIHSTLFGHPRFFLTYSQPSVPTHGRGEGYQHFGFMYECGTTTPCVMARSLWGDVTGEREKAKRKVAARPRRANVEGPSVWEDPPGHLGAEVFSFVLVFFLVAYLSLSFFRAFARPFTAPILSDIYMNKPCPHAHIFLRAITYVPRCKSRFNI